MSDREAEIRRLADELAAVEPDPELDRGFAAMYLQKALGDANASPEEWEEAFAAIGMPLPSPIDWANVGGRGGDKGTGADYVAAFGALLDRMRARGKRGDEA